jgi:hypothetical protein
MKAAGRTYLQIFSLTDHAKAFDGRFQGPYAGLNADLQTSELRDGCLRLATRARSPKGDLDRSAFERAELVVAYRHSDTGELRGTSEMLLPVGALPWTEMPGIELSRGADGVLAARIWNHTVPLPAGRLIRILFMKTVVLFRNCGEAAQLEWTDEELEAGPSKLHAAPVDQDLTIAPPSGSALTVKMGQEVQEGGG